MGAFVSTILLINPIRETSVDDDWTYALMVRHLLETGEYRLHEWLGPSLPFQTYWGGLFARVFGYSFASLRISTLVLAFFGLIAFYFLAREHGLNDTQAGLIMLGLLASPLVLFFSFTFNTDVPFLMCLIIALFLYTRAIRLHNYPLMLSASIAASAAILTRQFGLAIPAGVFSLWALSKEHRKNAPFFAAGLILPAAAGVWQLAMGALAPTKLQWRELHLTSLYYADIGAMLMNTVFRPTIILQYLALFSLPLVFLALLAFGYEIERPDYVISERKSARSQALLLCALTLYVLAGIIHGRVANHLTWLMPYVVWDFFDIADMGRWPRVIVTLITSVGAILYGYIFVLRYCDSRVWAGLPASARLLDLVVLFQLVEQFLYYKVGDRHLLPFLPFVYIAVGHYLARRLTRFRIVAGVACLIMLVVSLLWTRGRIEKEAAGWQGGQMLLAAGVQPAEIFGFYPWNCYYGIVDDYLAGLGDSKVESTKDFWSRWYPERRERAKFLIVDSAVTPKGEKWKVFAEIPYRGMSLREKRVYVVRRES